MDSDSDSHLDEGGALWKLNREADKLITLGDSPDDGDGGAPPYDCRYSKKSMGGARLRGIMFIASDIRQSSKGVGTILQSTGSRFDKTSGDALGNPLSIFRTFAFGSSEMPFAGALETLVGK